MPSHPFPQQNFLLAALPKKDYARLAPHLEWIELPLGQIIHDQHEQLEHVYFPTTAIISLAHILESDDMAEVAIIGNDGMAGIAMVMSGATTISRTLVQITGDAYRMEANIFKTKLIKAAFCNP